MTGNDHKMKAKKNHVGDQVISACGFIARNRMLYYTCLMDLRLRRNLNWLHFNFKFEQYDFLRLCLIILRYNDCIKSSLHERLVISYN